MLYDTCTTPGRLADCVLPAGVSAALHAPHHVHQAGREEEHADQQDDQLLLRGTRVFHTVWSIFYILFFC